VRKKSDLYDFSKLGQAIKRARKNKRLTREKFAEIIDLSPRYIMSIENKGQHPSLQKFYELVTMFNISVDEYFFPDAGENKPTYRRELDAILDNLNEKDLKVIMATAKAIQENNETGE